MCLCVDGLGAQLKAVGGSAFRSRSDKSYTYVADFFPRKGFVAEAALHAPIQQQHVQTSQELLWRALYITGKSWSLCAFFLLEVCIDDVGGVAGSENLHSQGKKQKPSCHANGIMASHFFCLDR